MLASSSDNVPPSRAAVAALKPISMCVWASPKRPRRLAAAANARLRATEEVEEEEEEEEETKGLLLPVVGFKALACAAAQA